MSHTWFLVADSSRAKLYDVEKRTAPFVEIEDFVHPEGRLHEGDLVSDRPGSDGGSIGQGRHVLDDKVSARDQAGIRFAAELAERLDAARNAGELERLVLVAPPAFLGLLRDKLSKEVLARVSKQIDKNLVQQPPEVLREYL